MNIQTGGAVYASLVADTPLIAANDAAGARAPVAALPDPPARVDAAQLAEAIASVQRFVQPSAQSLRFSVDKSAGKTVVQLVDEDSGEVLRQIPSQEMLSIARALDQMQGLLLHAKA